MKKFKHKKTGSIAVETEKGYLINSKLLVLNFNIKNYNDWEEIATLCVPDNSKFRVDKETYTIRVNKEDSNFVDLVHYPSGQSFFNHVSIRRANEFFEKRTWNLIEDKITTTEDGFDLVYGDVFFHVNINYDYGVSKGKIILRDFIKLEGYKIFKSKETADSFYKELKKEKFSVYSLSSIISELKNSYVKNNPEFTPIINDILNNLKEKLKI